MPSAPSPRDAQRIGQWTAFRKYADRTRSCSRRRRCGRTIPQGQQGPAEVGRNGGRRKAIVSCDGRTAVNTGRGSAPTASAYGYFTTVWQREKGEWRWVYDAADTLEGKPRAKPQQAASSAGLVPGARRPARR